MKHKPGVKAEDFNPMNRREEEAIKQLNLTNDTGKTFPL